MKNPRTNNENFTYGKTTERATELGYLFRSALEAAARGGKLTNDQRSDLGSYLNGDEWFTKRPSRFSDEARLATAQLLLLGRKLRSALDRASRDGELSKEEQKELQQWLSNARLLRARYQLKRLLYFVTYSGLLIWTLLFFKPGFSLLSENPLWIPFIISVAILTAALAKDIFFERNVSIALRQVVSTVEQGTTSLETFLEENLEPRISALESRERVRRTATRMFDEVIKDEPEKQLVIFMGAASLGTPKKNEPKDLDDEKMGSVEEYNSRLTQMQTAGVSVIRYVALIKSTDPPPARRSSTQLEYVDWLNKQIEILENNANYILVDCHRAQPWGGSRSSIVTKKSFLDLVGDGESGFLIKGERVTELLTASSKKLLDGARQKSYQGKNLGHIKDLKKLRNEMQALIKSNEATA